MTAVLDKVVVFPEEVTSPVKSALVVTVAAFPPMFKLATGVVEVTTSGAVPVATVEVNDPLKLRLVPVAAPITGVIRVGEVLITTLPVPVTAFETTFLLASVNKACEAVALENTGAAVRVVTPVTASVPAIVVFPDAAATMNLLVLTAKLPLTAVFPEKVLSPPMVWLIAVNTPPFV